MRGDLLQRPLTPGKAKELSRRLTLEEERELGHRLRAGQGALTRLETMAGDEGTDAECRELARLCGDGWDAGRELVARSGGLIHSIANRHCGEAIDFETLVEVGTDAALRVIGDFDPDRGRLSTFLHPWVTGAVVREVKRQLEDVPAKVPVTGSGDIERLADRQQAKVSAGRGKTGTRATADEVRWSSSRSDNELVSWLRGCDLPVPTRDFEYRPGPSLESLERAERVAERERRYHVVASFVRMSVTRDEFVALWGKQADRETDWEIICLRHHLGEFNSFDKPRRPWDVVAQRVGMKKRTVEKRYERAMNRLYGLMCEREAS